MLVLGTLSVGVAGCGDDSGAAAPDAGAPDAIDAAVAPIFRNAVTLDDEPLARAALFRLGVTVEGVPGDPASACVKCHALGPQRLRAWAALTDAAGADCLTDFAVTDRAVAAQMVACLREGVGRYTPARVGVWSTAASLPWFTYLFELAGEPAASFDDFSARVHMPRGEHAPFSQEDFDVVAEWFARGLPSVDELLPIGSPPDECIPAISGELTAHVNRMATEGWTAVNRDAGMLMFGCVGLGSPSTCLTDAPRVAAWELAGRGALRLLRALPYATDFWTRSSPDGRFVAHGATGDVLGTFGAAFVDLAEDRVIPAAAFYDPAFFPDGSGFVFHGGFASVCPQRVLTSSPATVSFREPGCLQSRAIGLYEQVGAGLAGGDLFVLDGQFENDDGGHEPTFADPPAEFTSTASVYVTPIVNDGTTFVVGTEVRIASPYEGDPILSPSARLALHRVAGPDGRQRGWVVRRVAATPTALGYDVALPEVGRICAVPRGGKPSISFDERWMVLHHYVEPADALDLGFTGADDPAFAPYLTAGAANLYLLDLLDGSARRLTNMGPGEYALYPHFRSDGWIYFIVRGPAGEEIVASDAVVALP